MKFGEDSILAENGILIEDEPRSAETIIESNDGQVGEATGSRLTPLMDIATGDVDPRKTILANRFLCIGGSMLFIGPSGIGKSSASV